ncbi:MAG: redoxin domain-containing protein [Bacteroidota bacterium]
MANYKSKYIFWLLLISLCHQHVIAQQKMLYPNLEKGKYDIGYKTIIDFDYSRSYNLSYPNDTSSSKHDPRPIIINIWYPATITKKDKSMLYGDYIKIPTQDVRLKPFIKRIEDYNEKNSAFYMFYENDLNEEQKKKFTSQLNLPIDVTRDATPLSEKFPLVIYHAGLGGTLNDNTILCEYLASHGFVVVTGAFQGNNYKEVDLDWDLERSTKDLDFMLNRIKNLPFIDFTKIAAIGHSFGAQAVLAYRTEDFSPVSWLIIIDTTMDYSVDAKPDDFGALTKVLYDKIENLNVPTLVFANPQATFRVVDSLQYSDRTYCTLEMEHNDFTSLTSLSKRNGLLKRNDSDTVWNKYTLVVDYCLSFLKSNIFDDKSAKQFISSEHPFTHVVEIPKGKKLGIKIPDYSDFSKPPTTIQLEKMLFEKKFEVVNKIFDLYPTTWSQDDIVDMGYIVKKRDVDIAIFLFKKNVELHPESWTFWDRLGEAYMVKGEKASAIKSYEKSVELNPKNDNGIKMIEKLTDHGMLPIGSKAPDFNLPAVDGKTYTLRSFQKAKILVVIFTCNHCPTAQGYEQRIIQLTKDYSARGVQVVAINPNDPNSLRLDELGWSDVGDSFEDMKVRAREKNFNFPYLYDGETEVASRKYGPVSTPHVFIFDQDRILRYRGRIDNEENPSKPQTEFDTRNALEALLNNKEVPVKETKVFGCSVKWAEKRDWLDKALVAWAKASVTIERADEPLIVDILKNTSNNLRLVHVWATSCSSCVAAFPDLIKISRIYQERDFEMVTISVDGVSNEDNVIQFLKKQQASNVNYLFEGDTRKLTNIIHPGWDGTVPYTLLVEPGGKVAFARQGAIDAEELRKMIFDNGVIGRLFK